MSMLLNQPYSTTTLVNYGKLEHRFPCSHACFLRTIFFPRAQVMRPQGGSDAQLFGAPFPLVARLSSPARRVESSNRFVRPGSVRPVRSPVPSTQAVRLDFLGLPVYFCFALPRNNDTSLSEPPLEVCGTLGRVPIPRSFLPGFRRSFLAPFLEPRTSGTVLGAKIFTACCFHISLPAIQFLRCLVVWCLVVVGRGPSGSFQLNL